MSEPGTLILAQATHETAGLTIGAAVCVQARQFLQQWCNEVFAESAGRPMLKFAKIQNVANDGESRIQIRPDINIGALNFHDYSLSFLFFFINVMRQMVAVMRQMVAVIRQMLCVRQYHSDRLIPVYATSRLSG